MFRRLCLTLVVSGCMCVVLCFWLFVFVVVGVDVALGCVVFGIVSVCLFVFGCCVCCVWLACVMLLAFAYVCLFPFMVYLPIVFLLF